MGRFPQRSDGRGSLRWIQSAVNAGSPNIDRAILECLPHASQIDWRSPLADDDYAEYRDAAFLETLKLGRLSSELGAFWPARGPQWDALGTTDADDVLLVEAKAHIREMYSPPSQAGVVSLERIRAALAETAGSLGAKTQAEWHVAFYQLANRLAHLRFLRSHGVSAKLVLVNFVGDKSMKGPSSEEAWRAAYDVVWHVMGLSRRHALSQHIIEIFPEVPDA